MGNGEMNKFIRNLISAHGGRVKDKDALHGLVPRHSGDEDVQGYERLRAELKDAPWIELNKSAVTLDEAGYQLIAWWKSNAKMNRFIREVINVYGGKITDVSAFHRIVPHHSGISGVQSYEDLFGEL